MFGFQIIREKSNYDDSQGGIMNFFEARELIYRATRHGVEWMTERSIQAQTDDSKGQFKACLDIAKFLVIDLRHQEHFD